MSSKRYNYLSIFASGKRLWEYSFTC